MFLTLFPLLGNVFAPTQSMPEGLGQFAEYQPFTLVADSPAAAHRGAIGTNAVIAIVWSVGLALVGYLWATRRYEHQGAVEPK